MREEGYLIILAENNKILTLDSGKWGAGGRNGTQKFLKIKGDWI